MILLNRITLILYFDYLDHIVLRWGFRVWSNPDDPKSRIQTIWSNPDDPWANPDDPWANPDDLWANPDDPYANPDDQWANPDDPKKTNLDDQKSLIRRIHENLIHGILF